MPSPFPGMDPFLEHPDVFPNLHGSFNIYLQEVIQPHLPESYYAAIGKRVWIEFSHRYVEPDVELLRSQLERPERSGSASGFGVAVAEIPSETITARAVVVRVPHEEFEETFLEIYSRREEGDLLVTSIEMLSPINKVPGEQGRELYLKKQREILKGRVHLVEIDLLRGGKHTTAVPLERAVEEAGPFDYHVCVHRFDDLENFIVYPIQLEERLPEIAIPLLPEDPSVKVDLQAIFNRCYEAGAYRRRIDYLKAVPIPHLRPAQVEWVKGRVGEQYKG